MLLGTLNLDFMSIMRFDTKDSNLLLDAVYWCQTSNFFHCMVSLREEDQSPLDIETILPDWANFHFLLHKTAQIMLYKWNKLTKHKWNE